MAVAYYYSSTAGSYTLTGSLSAGATSIPINVTTGLPSTTPYKIVLDPGTTSEEICKVTAVAGLTLTVVRGWDGTTAVSHAASAVIRHMMTAEDLTLSRTHEAATAAHGTGGSIVGTSDTQTLTNKNLTSGTNTFPTSLATLTGAQTLTNKNLTSGTNSFPSSLVTLTGAQTLTNKTAQAATAATPGLTVIGAASQTANHFEVKTSDNVVRFAIGSDGGFRMDSGFTVLDSVWAALGTVVTTIQPTGPTVRPLVLKGAASQSANLLEFQNSAGTVLAAVDSAGNVTGPNLGKWVSYTPSWTASTTNPSIGNGSIVGRVARNNGLTTYSIAITFGSTTSGGVGNYFFTLPDAPKDGAFTAVGSGHISTATGSIYGRTAVCIGTNVAALVADNSTRVSNSSPIATGAGVVIYLSGSYEVN